MISRRGYKEIFAAYDPMAITELDETIDQVREIFVQSNVDERIEEALPILAKIQEENMKEANIFEQWADRITEGTWALPDSQEQMAKLKELMSEPLPCGPDGEYATEQLYDLIGDDELFDDISELADRDPNADCRELVKARLADFDIVIDEAVSEGAMSDLHQHIGEMIADGDSNEEIKKMHPGVSDQNIDNIRRQMEESVVETKEIGVFKEIGGIRYYSVKNKSGKEKLFSGPTPSAKKYAMTEDPTQEEPAQAGNYQSQQAAAATGKEDSLKMGLGGDNDLDEANSINKSEEQDLDDEDMTEVTDIDTGKTALKAERDPMLEAELDRLLQLARG